MKNTQLTHQQHHPHEIKHSICFLLHDIESAANVGSLFRIADALGVEKIILSGNTPSPPNRKLKKVSRSTDQTIPYEVVTDVMKQIELLKSTGYSIICLEITASSRDIRDCSFTPNEKICLLPGSENTGVNEALLKASDQTVHLPMFGSNSSMNVAIATAIATFEIINKSSGQVTLSRHL